MDEELINYSNETYGLVDYSLMLNDSSVSIETLECLLKHHNASLHLEDDSCNTTWDGLSCWPPTPAGTSAVIRCMEFFNGVPYDTTQNATRECAANGTWAVRSDYSQCQALEHKDESFQVLWDVKDAHTIYSIGYGLSLIALALALWIFLYFNDLRCLRNTIHTNLLVTYLFIDLTWIITAALQASSSSEANKAACFLVILLTYLMGTNFFWMFVEGLYLYMLVVKTFSVEKIKLHIYALIGWGLPAIVVIPWAIVKSQFSNDHHTTWSFHGCPWQNKDHFDYIFICPVIIVLVVNIYFLTNIMWVLITKLRAATSLESKQYRKAAKALLVLIPLLGVTYVLVIVTPAHRTARVVFSYAQALLLSTQGFTVAVLYCFMNGEVRKSVRHHLLQWKDQRGLSTPTRPQHQRGARSVSLSTSGTWLSTKSRPPEGAASYSPLPARDETV